MFGIFIFELFKYNGGNWREINRLIAMSYLWKYHRVRLIKYRNTITRTLKYTRSSNIYKYYIIIKYYAYIFRKLFFNEIFNFFISKKMANKN